MKKYFKNVLISIDQFGNALTGGDPDETISSRLGKLLKEWKANPSNKGRYLITIYLCKALHIFDKNHCERSVDLTEGKDDIWRNKNG